MTTQEPESPTTPDPLDPEGPETGEALTFVRTGWVRCTTGGQIARLRPPLFGEYKRLRMALEDVQDAIMALSEDAEINAERIVALEAEIGDVDPAERVKRRRELRRESTEIARRTNREREALMHGWWADVFRTLCVDAAKVDWIDDPDRMPAWLTAPALPQRILAHWRAAPLARG